MKWTKEALKLIKGFASGVACPEWNEETIEKTMFYPHCADFARKTGKEEIDEEVVKNYILNSHNPATVQIGTIGKESIEAIENCMARPRKTNDDWVCVHGTATVMSISQEEAEFLEKRNKELLKSLR